MSSNYNYPATASTGRERETASLALFEGEKKLKDGTVNFLRATSEKKEVTASGSEIFEHIGWHSRLLLNAPKKI